jgi:hypothetical protein
MSAVAVVPAVLPPWLRSEGRRAVAWLLGLAALALSAAVLVGWRPPLLPL